MKRLGEREVEDKHKAACEVTKFAYAETPLLILQAARPSSISDTAKACQWQQKDSHFASGKSAAMYPGPPALMHNSSFQLS